MRNRRAMNFNRPRGSGLSQWQGPRDPKVGDRMDGLARDRAYEAVIRKSAVLRRFQKIDDHPELMVFSGARVSAHARRKNGKAPVTLVRLACLEKEET